MKSIVFLYSEMMPYMESVIHVLVHEYNYSVHVVFWDTEKKTQYKPKPFQNVIFHKRSETNFIQLTSIIKNANPSLIYVSGRMDSLYLKICKKFKSEYKIISGLDTQMKLNIKSLLKIVLSKILYKRYFDFLWVPGSRQYLMARLLSYSNNKIISNLYSGDDYKFNKVKKLTHDNFKKNILFIGRLEKSKGFDKLIEVWKEFSKIEKNGWELVVVGEGSLKDKYYECNGVNFKGFLEQEDIKNLLTHISIMILPSKYEPWGVVVHELALAGKALICTNKVGAADSLLINDFNGYLLPDTKKTTLRETLTKVFDADIDEIIKMSENSKVLSKRISSSISASSLISIVK